MLSYQSFYLNGKKDGRFTILQCLIGDWDSNQILYCNDWGTRIRTTVSTDESGNAFLYAVLSISVASWQRRQKILDSPASDWESCLWSRGKANTPISYGYVFRQTKGSKLVLKSRPLLHYSSHALLCFGSIEKMSWEIKLFKGSIIPTTHWHSHNSII